MGWGWSVVGVLVADGLHGVEPVLLGRFAALPLEEQRVRYFSVGDQAQIGYGGSSNRRNHFRSAFGLYRGEHRADRPRGSNVRTLTVHQPTFTILIFPVRPPESVLSVYPSQATPGVLPDSSQRNRFPPPTDDECMV